jgi:membrane fusion protein
MRHEGVGTSVPPWQAATGRVDDTNDLIREEAVQFAMEQRQYGEILIRGTRWTIFLVGLLLAMPAMAILALGFVSYTAKVHVVGEMVPSKGVILVSSPTSGDVGEIAVTQGSHVRAGDRLISISRRRSSREVPDVDARVIGQLSGTLEALQRDQSALSDQIAARRSKFTLRERTSKEAVGSLERQIAFQKERVDLISQQAQRFAELSTIGFASQTQLQSKQTELLEAKSKLEDIMGQRWSKLRELQDAEAETNREVFQLERDTQATLRQISDLQNSILDAEATKESLVRAVQGGIVTSVVTTTGQHVVTGQPLLQIVPESSLLELELYVPTNAGAFIDVGQEVYVELDAFPAQKFGLLRATIASMSSTALPLKEVNSGLAGGSTTNVYILRASIQAALQLNPGIAIRAKPGMHVEGYIKTNSMSALEWIFRPLLPKGLFA